MAIKKETLEKQLSVLSKRSETAPNDELCDLTGAMCQVVKELQTIEAREAAAAFASASMERNKERWSERQRQNKEAQTDSQSKGIVEKVKCFF